MEEFAGCYYLAVRNGGWASGMRWRSGRGVVANCFYPPPPPPGDQKWRMGQWDEELRAEKVAGCFTWRS